jgi:hypothetical protein
MDCSELAKATALIPRPVVKFAMDVLARLHPATEHPEEIRTLICLQCGQLILSAANFPNSDASETLVSHTRSSADHRRVTAADIRVTMPLELGVDLPDALLLVKP